MSAESFDKRINTWSFVKGDFGAVGQNYWRRAWGWIVLPGKVTALFKWSSQFALKYRYKAMNAPFRCMRITVIWPGAVLCARKLRAKFSHMLVSQTHNCLDTSVGQVEHVACGVGENSPKILSAITFLASLVQSMYSRTG